MDFDWKSIVRTVAPTIASVFGTPLAGMGVTAILNAILPEGEAKPENPEDFLATALNGANPEMMMKMKAADQQFKMDIRKLDIDLEKFLVEQNNKNTEGARLMKSEWLKSDKWDYEPVLAGLVVLAFLYAEWWVFNYAMSTASIDANKAMLVGKMLALVEAAFLALIYFRWGSSESSRRKTEITAQANAITLTKVPGAGLP